MLSELSEYPTTASRFRICVDESGKEPIFSFFLRIFFLEVNSARHCYARSRSSKLSHAGKLILNGLFNF